MTFCKHPGLKNIFALAAASRSDQPHCGQTSIPVCLLHIGRTKEANCRQLQQIWRLTRGGVNQRLVWFKDTELIFRSWCGRRWQNTKPFTKWCFLHLIFAETFKYLKFIAFRLTESHRNSIRGLLKHKWRLTDNFSGRIWLVFNARKLVHGSSERIYIIYHTTVVKRKQWSIDMEKLSAFLAHGEENPPVNDGFHSQELAM